MPVIDVFYYLNNFQSVLDSIKDRYADLLNESESGFIHQFNCLPRSSRALAVRMIMRKPRLFLAQRLQYAEIGALPDAMEPLLKAGWVDGDPLLSIEDLFNVLTKPQLLAGLQLARGESQFAKPALLDRCRLRLSIPQTASQWFPREPLHVIRLKIAPLCERLRLLYFGNFHQSWTEFVLSDLGVKRFEQFDATAARPFVCRRQWDDFEQIYRCREMLHQQADPHTVLAQVPDPITGCDWLESRRQRLLFRVGEALERVDAAPAALGVYATISHPGAAVRAMRIREAGGDAISALSACELALANCAHESDRVLLSRARKRLRRRLSLTSTPEDHSQRPRAQIIDLIMDQPDEPYTVEHLVSGFLMQNDPDARIYYVENCLITGLFGLLCWRALFAPIDGAFFHPFHRQPADLNDSLFYARRRHLFNQCLMELDDGSYRHSILQNYHSKNAIENAFVVWPAIGEAMLKEALQCIPAHHLKGWFELLARDYQANRTGFPDLIQLWPGVRRYRMIEVKAPGDRLQDNQRRVLSLCMSFDMPVAVCKVQWATAANLGGGRPRPLAASQLTKHQPVPRSLNEKC